MRLPFWFTLALCLVSTYPQSNAIKLERQSGPSGLSPVYQRWVNEDVRWIITPDEKAAFLRLSSNADRNDFVKQFWLRRDPTPGTEENEFKEEHYRRLAYANTHFASTEPGWKTDRGKIYIVYGPPDKISSQVNHSAESSHSIQTWYYRSVQGYEHDLLFESVDTCDCGNYRLEDSVEH